MKLYNANDLKNSRIFFDKKPPMFFQIFILCVLIILIGAFWICTILPKNYIVQAQGTITTEDNIYVGALADGIVIDINKQEGEQVEVDDVLFTLSNGSEGIQMNALSKQITQAEDKLEAMGLYEKSLTDDINYLKNDGLQQEYFGKMEYYLSMLKDEAATSKNQQDEISKKKEKLKIKQNELHNIHDEIAKLQERLKTAQEQQPQDELPPFSNVTSSQSEELKAEIVSKNSEAESKQTEIESLESEITQSEQQATSSQSVQTKLQLISELGSARTTVETNIVELQAQLEAYKNQDALTEVKASKSGYLHYLTPLKDGMSIQKAQTIAEISQNKENQMMVEAYIQATDISKVNINDPVKVAIQGVNTQKYGTLSGTLKKIDSGTLTQESKDGNIILYKCQITIDDKELRSSNGESIKALKSMPVTARILYDSETYMDWLLEMLNFQN